MNMGTTYEETITTAPDTDATYSADEAAIRALYQQMMEGWNKGSSEAFAAPFTEEADFIAFDGTRFKGRQEIISSHEPLFEKWMKGSRLVEYAMDIRLLDQNSALIHVVGGTVMPGQVEPSPERDSIQTLVAVRRRGKWWLTAFQNTRIRPMARTTMGTFMWLFSDWLWKLFRLNKPRK
jgi:uncharacterized protein (TIGR02246 family)